MLGTVKTLLASQFDAALCTLNVCVERCPDEAWHALRVANLKFCQAVFHTLFFADYYLGPDGDKDAFPRSRFTATTRRCFATTRSSNLPCQVLLYERPWIGKYLQHCRTKAANAIESETAESLRAPAAFGRRAFSRAELYVYNTRHIQHHAAQLSLRLRLDHGIDVPWVGSGWRDL